jgi:hypothetical protein
MPHLVVFETGERRLDGIAMDAKDMVKGCEIRQY